MKLQAQLTFKDTSETIVFDTIRSTSVSCSSTVTQHPTIEGNYMADHMFRNANNISISGVFSLQTAKDLGLQTLGELQEKFEALSDNAVVMNLSKYFIDTDTQNKIYEFKQRQNLVLTSINWTENINTADFSMSFQEILMTSAGTIEFRQDDDSLPPIDYPTPASFADIGLDQDILRQQIIEILHNEGLLADELYRDAAIYGVASVVGIGGAAGAVALLGGGAAVAAIGATATIPIVGVALAGLGCLIYGIVAAIRSNNKSIAVIRAQSDLDAFIDKCMRLVRQLNQNVYLYKLNEDVAQRAIVDIGGTYYEFTFTKTNSTISTYDVNVNMWSNNGTTVNMTSATLNDSITDLPNSSYEQKLFETIDNHYIYLLKLNANEPTKLTSYAICDSKLLPSEINDEIIKNVKSLIG